MGGSGIRRPFEIIYGDVRELSKVQSKCLSDSYFTSTVKAPASHVLSALDRGTEIVDSAHAKQERYAAKKAEKEKKETT